MQLNNSGKELKKKKRKELASHTKIPTGYAFGHFLGLEISNITKSPGYFSLLSGQMKEAQRILKQTLKTEI